MLFLVKPFSYPHYNFFSGTQFKFKYMSEHRLEEIVIERPRYGMRIRLRKLTGIKKHLRKLTEEAAEDGLLRPYLFKPKTKTQKTKVLSDNLAPLKRFLRSQAGKPWNDVYSQLCQRLDSNTMAGQHVLSHVWWYVERHVELIDGIPHSKPRGGSLADLGDYYHLQLYVHPETGILCLVEKLPGQPRQPRTDVVILNKNYQYHKLKEIWYLIGFKDFPPSPTESVEDLLEGSISRDRAKWTRGRSIYAVSKRQCSKKEIRFIKNQLSKLSTGKKGVTKTGKRLHKQR